MLRISIFGKTMLLIMLSTLLFILEIQSQNIEFQRDIWVNALNEIMVDRDDEQDINLIIERLSELVNNPILINMATKEELEQIPFLSDKQIENLLYYLYVFGEMKSIHELWLVEDFDRRTIDLVSPFFKIQPREKVGYQTVDNLFRNLKIESVIRLNTVINRKEGYVDKCDSLLAINPDCRYLGNSLAYTFRYKMEKYRRWKTGIIVKKDAGEKGSDSYAFYMQMLQIGNLGSLIIGDYKAHFGSGLVINQGFSMGKNGMGISLLRRNSGFIPHASVDEYNYLRGVAAEIHLSRIRFYPFWSYRTFDATVRFDTVCSIQKSGLHRLPRETARRNKASLMSSGFHIDYRGKIGEAGVTFLYQVFDPVYYPDIKPYNRFQFRGRVQANISADYQLQWHTLSFKGETALSQNGALATVNALAINPGSGLDFQLLYRYYHRSYHSWWGRSFSESSSLSNETGIALYMNYQLHKYWFLSMGFDWFRFPWIRYGVNNPSSGFETSFQLSFQQSEKWRLCVRYKLKQSDKNNSSDADSLPSVRSYQRHLSTAFLDVKIDKLFFLRTTLEGVFYQFQPDDTTFGLLYSQQVGVKLPNLPLQVDSSFGLFDTKDSNTRVYLSEKNILYGFGIPSFSGNGMRTSLTVRYDMAKWLTLWIKYANTCYFDRDSIGTGLEKMNGNTKNDLWLQIRCKF